MTIAAIIQARTGSTRLPEKVLADISGKPMLAHVFKRISYIRNCNKIVLATTRKREDDCLVSLAEQYQVYVFRGSSHDVLGRYYYAAKEHEADIIVRITADDPFKDPVLADKIIDVFLKDDYEYVSNTIEPSYPEGLDIEVFSFDALFRSFNEAAKKFEREHVTPYIWMHPEKFKLLNVAHKKNLSFMRWTIDTPKDLAFAREIYKRLYPEKETFLMEDIIALLKSDSKLMKMMPKLQRNEGLYRSMES